MAAVMAVGFTLAGGLASRARGVPSLVLAVAALVQATAVLASASRGGALALAVGGVVLAAGQRRRRRMIYLVTLRVLVVWQSASRISRRIATLVALRTDYNVQGEHGTPRHMERGMSCFADHPILGVGAGNFEMAEGAWLERSGGHGKWSAPHNAYIQAFADLGMVGGVLFLSLIAVTARRAWRLWRPRVSPSAAPFHHPELLAALCAFCVAALFLSLAYSAVFVTLMGLTTLASGTARGSAPGSWPVAAAVDPAWFRRRVG
jgi:O-antigen ligase